MSISQTRNRWMNVRPESCEVAGLCSFFAGFLPRGDRGMSTESSIQIDNFADNSGTIKSHWLAGLRQLPCSPSVPAVLACATA